MRAAWPLSSVTVAFDGKQGSAAAAGGSGGGDADTVWSPQENFTALVAPAHACPRRVSQVWQLGTVQSRSVRLDGDAVGPGPNGLPVQSPDEYISNSRPVRVAPLLGNFMTVSVRAAHDPLKDQAQEPPIDALVMHESAAA